MRVKVIHFITGLNTGGAEMMLYKTIKSFDRDRFEPVVVSLLPPGAVSEMIERQGTKVYHLNLRNKVMIGNAFIKLLIIFLKEKPHIVHNYMFHADILGRIAGRITGVPIIISSIRNENIGGRIREKIMRHTDILIDKTTAVCKVAGKKQVQAKSIKEEKLKVIYNGIEIEKFANKKNKNEIEKRRKNFGIPENHLVFVTVGRIEVQKNHKLLIEAFSRILKKYSDVSLLVVGDGVLRNKIERLAVQLGINNNIIFTGRRSDVPELLAISDVFVLTSDWEGMPNVVLEAMAARLPVVATSVGGVPEAIVNHITGLLVRPNNIDELHNCLQEIITMSTEERNIMGQAGREHVEQNFTIDKTVKETEQLYMELLKNKGIIVGE